MGRPTKHIITEQEYLAVKEAAKANKLKRVDKRLQVIILRYEGMDDADIAQTLGYHSHYISQLCAAFKKQGLEVYAKHNMAVITKLLKQKRKKKYWIASEKKPNTVEWLGQAI